MLANRPLILVTTALAAGLAPAAAQAQAERPIGAMAGDIQKGGEGQVDLFPSKKDDAAAPDTPFKPDLLIVPIPQSSPTLGAGVTLAGVYFYNPNQSPQPWISGVGFMYTKNKSWGAGAFHSMSLGHDRIRALAFVGYADVNIDFYGVGPQAGARGVSVDMNDSGYMGVVQAQYRLVPHLYAGGRFQFMAVKSSIAIPNPLFPDLDLPKPELDSQISAIGPVFTFDTRDNNTNPKRGALVTLLTMFNLKDLGSDFNYRKMTFAANGYIPVTRSATLGLRASVCGVSRGGPFYDLCMYGMGNDLRGYETGRYRGSRLLGGAGRMAPASLRPVRRRGLRRGGRHGAGSGFAGPNHFPAGRGRGPALPRFEGDGDQPASRLCSRQAFPRAVFRDRRGVLSFRRRRFSGVAAPAGDAFSLSRQCPWPPP